uniref:Uncharacterized protein n=1 Tax=Anguilla anguilla TaxID=7936 RepID=A0A0E9PSY6_ANGAN
MTWWACLLHVLQYQSSLIKSHCDPQAKHRAKTD